MASSELLTRRTAMQPDLVIVYSQALMLKKIISLARYA